MSLREYFFGTESKEAIFNNKRNDLNELRSYGSDLSPSQEASRIAKYDILIGKWAPNIISAGSIVGGILTRDASYLSGVVAGEGLRLAYDRTMLMPHRERAERENLTS